MLVFTSAILGAVEPGLTDELAEEMDGDSFSVHDTRERLGAERNRPGISIASDVVKAEMLKETTDPLAEGVDVFVDPAFNSNRSRSNMPLHIAGLVNAMAVAINIQAPDLTVVRNRLSRWEEDDTIPLPARYWEAPIDDFIEKAGSNIEFASQRGFDGHVITIDGSGSLEDSVGQVMDEFDRLGIEPL